MASYKLSDGSRIEKSIIDRRVREAKQEKIESMLSEYGYIFCEECGVNQNAGMPLDCSHTKSVYDCQKDGESEKAYDTENIKIRCRKCHEKLDNLGVQWSNF